MDDDEKLIIILSDFIDKKNQKEKELAFYRERLDVLAIRMKFVQQEINLTNKIIKIIESETVLQIKVT